MDKVGQSWQVAIELLSLSKIGYIDLKKSHQAGQTFEISGTSTEALSPTVLGFQDFLSMHENGISLRRLQLQRRDH